ncbi:16S rRNA (cytosine(1402)-N(4))-methyltransferase RsmH [[Mycoplasma] imitans]|uniref:16S rRNA (cytosine(1402)-N(4))-methyltransferase RsmH n=1 Tax=[Mycoplasma] imitans TaxID=29560 RepID=UPI001FDF15C7|nr:16S rRNA (cytosine(1402)-N(4))-methyltransferase RsmH [[Mycoplasma] imitans]
MIINNNIHYPVLLKEVLDNLITKKDGTYLDLTIGFGGHSYNIIKALNDQGRLIGFDQDQQAIAHCKQLFSEFENVSLVNDNFVNLKKHLQRLNVNKIDGCLIDLGVSSYQLDEPQRGFSYHSLGRFDMRMNQEQELDATKLIQNSSIDQLVKIMRNYGEIKDPYRVVVALKKAFEQKELNTLEVVELIKNNLKKSELYAKKHPARKYFQAIRIAVNNELEVLEKLLSYLPNYLNKNGRIAIITFHSLEEKIVKKAFRNLSATPLLNNIPINNELLKKYHNHFNKGLSPTEQELNNNRRSRSAKLFVLEKITD